MTRILKIALGVMTAIGGFVDVGNLVTSGITGARFGMSLTWAIVIGTIGMTLYGEMAGRVSAVARRPVFHIVRERLGVRTALANLAAFMLLSLLTLAAEIGGVALVLELVTGFNYLVWVPLIGLVALHQHVRTVLAPYLAVHGELGGTRAALTSWELGGRHFWHLLGTFVLGSLPVALPLGVAYLAVERFGPDPLSAALLAASWQLGWVGVQSTRGLLIPALHNAYEDLYAAALIDTARG